MKKKIYPELTALKGKIREEKKSYRGLAEKINMSLNALNNKLNGYSIFDTNEVGQMVEALNIEPTDIVKYFFPRMLRNATKSQNEEAATKEAV